MLKVLMLWSIALANVDVSEVLFRWWAPFQFLKFFGKSFDFLDKLLISSCSQTFLVLSVELLALLFLFIDHLEPLALCLNLGAR
jgi:hypothetical protein